MALKTVPLAAPDAPPEGAPQNAPPTAASASSPDRRKRVLMIGGLVLAALVALLVGRWWLVGRHEVHTDNAYVRADITQISAKVQGYVASVAVRDNQAVKAGDLLVTLEDADFVARVAEAKAALAQAEADLETARAHAAATRAAIQLSRGQAASQADAVAEARARSEAARATAELSVADAGRYAELAEQGWYPRARLESAEAARRSAEALLAQARAGVTVQRSQLTTARTAISRAQQEHAAARGSEAAAKARIEAARARLANAELDLSRTRIRAPVDGVVANRTVSVGQLLSPGLAAMAVVPVQEAYVVANFKETQVRNMKPGQHVSLKIDAYPGLKVTGRVESLAPASGGQFALIPQDTATGNFTKIVQRVPVRIAIEPDALATGLMRPGLSVVATVTTRAG